MNRQNRRQMLRLYLGMLLSVLLASLFFSGLYRFNNKYTQHTTPAVICGMTGHIIPMCC